MNCSGKDIAASVRQRLLHRNASGEQFRYLAEVIEAAQAAEPRSSRHNLGRRGGCPLTRPGAKANQVG